MKKHSFDPPKSCPLCNGPLHTVEKSDDSSTAVFVCKNTITGRGFYCHTSHYRFVADEENMRIFTSYKQCNAKISNTKYLRTREETVLSVFTGKETHYIKVWNTTLPLDEIKDLLFKYSGFGAMG